MLKLKNIFKRLKFLLRSLIFREFQPYKFINKIFPRKQYSNFFIYDANMIENSFIAENIYSLMNDRNIEVNHEFRFFENTGEYKYNFKLKTNKFIQKINFPNYQANKRYLSFTHKVSIDKNSKRYIKNGKKMILNHRGYSIFKKEKSSIGSILHSNFGGLIVENNIKFSATERRNQFRYTSSYIFKKENLYNLVFNNPTNKKLKIIINSLDNNQINEEIKIDSLGNKFLTISNYEGAISFISKLPICRCIIFKNPDHGSHNFDVLHS